MSPKQDRAGVPNRERTTAGHLTPVNLQSAPPLIADMIRTLVPNGKHADIMALFEHRTTFGTIKGWRKGRRPAPQWAIDLCVRRLAHSAKLMERARAARGAISGNYAPNILTHNATRMEKAGN